MLLGYQIKPCSWLICGDNNGAYSVLHAWFSSLFMCMWRCYVFWLSCSVPRISTVYWFSVLLLRGVKISRTVNFSVSSFSFISFCISYFKHRLYSVYTLRLSFLFDLRKTGIMRFPLKLVHTTGTHFVIHSCVIVCFFHPRFLLSPFLTLSLLISSHRSFILFTCLFLVVHRRENTGFSPFWMWLASLNLTLVHPLSCRCHDSVFYGQIRLRCVYVSHLLYPVTCWQVLWLFPSLPLWVSPLWA